MSDQWQLLSVWDLHACLKATFWLYGNISAVELMFIFFFVPETRGKTEAEIREIIDDFRRDGSQSHEPVDEEQCHVEQPLSQPEQKLKPQKLDFKLEPKAHKGRASTNGWMPYFLKRWL